MTGVLLININPYEIIDCISMIVSVKAAGVRAPRNCVSLVIVILTRIFCLIIFKIQNSTPEGGRRTRRR
jgi:hypothetical protein